MPWQRSRGIHAARLTARRLRLACTQVAIFGVWADEAGKSKAKAAAKQVSWISAVLLILPKERACSGPHSDDLPGTGSKSDACGVSGTTESLDFATAARQIAGKVERHPGRSYGLRPESKADRLLAMLAS
jgi:hypothetical protein